VRSSANREGINNRHRRRVCSDSWSGCVLDNGGGQLSSDSEEASICSDLILPTNGLLSYLLAFHKLLMK